MLDLSCFAELLEKFSLSSGFTPEDIALLKDTPFESFEQVENMLKEIKGDAEKK